MSAPHPSRWSLPEGRFASSGLAAAGEVCRPAAGRGRGTAVQSLMGLLALTMILYLVAPTAQQLGASLGNLLGRGGRR